MEKRTIKRSRFTDEQIAFAPPPQLLATGKK